MFNIIDKLLAAKAVLLSFFFFFLFNHNWLDVVSYKEYYDKPLKLLLNYWNQHHKTNKLTITFYFLLTFLVVEPLVVDEGIVFNVY